LDSEKGSGSVVALLEPRMDPDPNGTSLRRNHLTSKRLRDH